MHVRGSMQIPASVCGMWRRAPSDSVCKGKKQDGVQMNSINSCHVILLFVTSVGVTLLCISLVCHTYGV